MTSDNINLIFYVSVSKGKKIRFFLNTRDPEILNDRSNFEHWCAS